MREAQPWTEAMLALRYSIIREVDYRRRREQLIHDVILNMDDRLGVRLSCSMLDPLSDYELRQCDHWLRHPDFTAEKPTPLLMLEQLRPW